MFINFFKFSKKPDHCELVMYLVDAMLAFENGQFDEAARLLRLITMVNPEHPLAHLMLGRCLIELADWKRAIESLFDHLRIEPNSVECLIHLGLAYYECGRLEMAIERFEQALEIRENSVLARENLAITKLSAGELQEALDDFVTLHRLKPLDSTITELLVLTLGKLGSWEAAKQYVHSMENQERLELVL